MRKLISFCILVAVAIPCYGKIIYVDADAAGSNDGSSWADAYNYLQDALTIAVAGDEILVAEGIYRPDESHANPGGTGDRNKKFRLLKGVKMRGGYAGVSESNPNFLDPWTYETILSGDLNENDVEVVDALDLRNDTTRTENSKHVVDTSGADNTTELDGFTITGGRAESYGGGLYNISGSPLISNCQFYANSSGYRGGGLYNKNGSNPTLDNCVFRKNYAREGAAMCGYTNCSPTLIGCLFEGNKTTVWSGGGMYNRYDSNPSVINCYFLNNAAGDNGGGILNDGNSRPYFRNCVFIGNQANSGGGAIENSGNSTATLTNCTLVNNSANHNGGGISNMSSSSILTNCILWGNTDPGGSDFSAQIFGGKTLKINYCCIQGWGNSMEGTGNIGEDPLLEVDYYHLQLNSPCINTGDPEYIMDEDETDIDGEFRVMDGRVDIGADEVMLGPLSEIEWLLNEAIQNKNIASESLVVALTNEKTALAAFKEYLSNRGSDDIDREKVIKAQNKVRMAFIHERIANRMLAKSIRELEKGLEILRNGNNSNSIPPEAFRAALDDFDGLMMTDVNSDQRIDMKDLAQLCKYWLEEYEMPNEK